MSDYIKWRDFIHIISSSSRVSKSMGCDIFPSVLVGWATGRASGLQKTGCWFVGGDDLTGDLHDL